MTRSHPWPPARQIPSRTDAQPAKVQSTEHGWPVAPGPACDGLAYTRGHTRERLLTLEPVLRSSRTARDVRVVRSWWTLAEYTILACAGEAFDVIEAPTWLAVMATGRPEFRERLCPVSLTPAGVRMLVEPGAVLRDDLADVRGVQITEAGSWVPMPPSRMLPGSASWWIRPEQVAWRVGDADSVQHALAAVLAEAQRFPPSGAGGEANAEL